jgi:predicted DNA-binding transcriptional regulator AlpA
MVWVRNTVQCQDTKPVRVHGLRARYLQRVRSTTGPRQRPNAMKHDRTNVLPQSLAPRGLSREQAAAYVGISPSLFDMLVKDGRMPVPKRVNARNVWDRLQLDGAFAALPSQDDASNPWDEVAV